MGCGVVYWQVFCRPGLGVKLAQQLVGAPEVRDNDAAANHQSDIECLFLLRPRCAQAARLDDVVVDAVIAAQPRRDHQPHEFLIFCWNRPFQVGVVIDIVEALDQIIVCGVDDGVEFSTSVDELPSSGTSLGDFVFRIEVGGLFAIAGHRDKVSRMDVALPRLLAGADVGTKDYAVARVSLDLLRTRAAIESNSMVEMIVREMTQ